MHLICTLDTTKFYTLDICFILTPDVLLINTLDINIIHSPCRVIKKLKTPTTDTDDTDEDRDVGGQSMYSHNSMCLNHQHWVDQVVSAGGFNVHCAQGPESSHKFNMHIAAARVRHDASSNVTQTNMLHYLCEQLLFQTILLMEDDTTKVITAHMVPRNDQMSTRQTD